MPRSRYQWYTVERSRFSTPTIPPHFLPLHANQSLQAKPIFRRHCLAGYTTSRDSFFFFSFPPSRARSPVSPIPPLTPILPLSSPLLLQPHSSFVDPVVASLHPLVCILLTCHFAVRSVRRTGCAATFVCRFIGSANFLRPSIPTNETTRAAATLLFSLGFGRYPWLLPAKRNGTDGRAPACRKTSSKLFGFAEGKSVTAVSLKKYNVTLRMREDNSFLFLWYWKGEKEQRARLRLEWKLSRIFMCF